MRLLSTAVAFGTLVSVAAALPAVHTYRGDSRYATQAVEDDDSEPLYLPNPREDPDFYAEHYARAAQLDRGDWHQRPAWADSALERLAKAAERLELVTKSVGFDVASVAGVLSRFIPAAGGRPNFEGSRMAKFSFDPKGEEFTLSSNASVLSDQSQPGFDYLSNKVRGVNIGNWLLFELWMDPYLARKLNSRAINAPRGVANPIVDEWTMGLYSDYRYAESVMKNHYDTWITEKDFADIAAAGLNHVRIPFPYWAFREMVGPRAHYLTFDQFDKLKQGVAWAGKYGLKVWVDLHGVPGSQNGYDNGGRAGAIHWADNPDYYRRTLATLNKLVQEFTQPAYRGVVTAIQPVNEPAANRNEGVKQLLNRYYPAARRSIVRAPGNTLMAFHDAFLTPSHWENFFTEEQRRRTVLDTHPYYVYSTAQKTAKDSARLREVCGAQGTFRRSQNFYPTIAGEMAPSGPNGDNPADRDLPVGPVKFPNGQGPRNGKYDYSVKYMAFMARNFAVQTHTFEKGAGWIMWAWRNEGRHDWSYKAGLENGWIPRDLNARPYGANPCARYQFAADDEAADEVLEFEEDQQVIGDAEYFEASSSGQQHVLPRN